MPPVSSGPYPTVENCLTAARALANDMANSVLGNALADNQPYVLPYADLAHKTLRKMLTARGVNTYSAYGYALALVQSATTDPTVQMQLTYAGYFDGVMWHGPTVSAPQWNSGTTYTQGQLVNYSGLYYLAQPNSGVNLNFQPNLFPSFWTEVSAIGPTLPSDLAEPLELWERATVANGVNTTQWNPMKQASDSISTRSITGAFRVWDWESDTLYLPPAAQTNDLKFKYLKVTPRLTDFNQQVPMNDCDMAMGALICQMYSTGRGGAEAAAFSAEAERQVGLLAMPTERKEQYASYNRKPFRATRARRRR
ncbi:MAG: hypothetical protein WBS33_17370 [Verrucomicrobiia bacterium]